LFYSLIYIIFFIAALLPSICFAQQTDELLRQTKAYHQQGNASAAIQKLHHALQQTTHLTADYLKLNHELVKFHIATRQLELAQTHAQQNVNIAKKLDNRLFIAKSLTQLAHIATIQQQIKQAQQYYLQALNIDFQDNMLKNMILLHLSKFDADYISLAIENTNKLKISPEKVNALLLLGKQQNNIDFYQQALKIALQLNQPRLNSLAYGYLAEFYHKHQKDKQALSLLQSAIFFSQNEIDLLYRWQWRKAQLLQQKNKISSAIKYYQLSIENIEKIRSALLLNYTSQDFTQYIKPVYFELIDILLRQASEKNIKKQILLQQVINILENYKSLELENYFQDDCITKFVNTNGNIPDATAIFYPILLTERSELLLKIQGKIIQITVEQQYSQDLQWLIKRFLPDLEQRTAQKIYTWLIEPIEIILQQYQIDTVVIVPYDILYTLPFAALHDGNDYLIKKYALAITPSLQLTNLKPNNQLVYQLLAGGLSQSVGNYPALPHVNQELKQINMIWNKKQLVKNDKFKFDVLYTHLKKQPYSLLHLATHAQIMPQAKNSFLLTYQGKMNVNQLEKLVRLRQFQQQPIELLTLSACQTAQTGDRLAALGIAGLAVKSGANSVLASLWAIDDAATARLIPFFYQQLAKKHISKAQSLQQAQWKLMQLTTYQHPRYWSGFILIGNWL
jgi:CHAT domain-containing protein